MSFLLLLLTSDFGGWDTRCHFRHPFVKDVFPFDVSKRNSGVESNLLKVRWQQNVFRLDAA